MNVEKSTILGLTDLWQLIEHIDGRYTDSEMGEAFSPLMVEVVKEAAKVQFVFGGPWIENVIHKNDLGGLKKALDALQTAVVDAIREDIDNG